MKKNDKRRRGDVVDAISGISIPVISVMNDVSGEEETLENMIIDKLSVDLLEQECSSSGNKPFDWMLDDIKGCQELEDFLYFIPQSYSNNGELHYNNSYDFNVD